MSGSLKSGKMLAGTCQTGETCVRLKLTQPQSWAPPVQESRPFWTSLVGVPNPRITMHRCVQECVSTDTRMMNVPLDFVRWYYLFQDAKYRLLCRARRRSSRCPHRP